MTALHRSHELVESTATYRNALGTERTLARGERFPAVPAGTGWERVPAGRALTPLIRPADLAAIVNNVDTLLAELATLGGDTEHERQIRRLRGMRPQIARDLAHLLQIAHYATRGTES